MVKKYLCPRRPRVAQTHRISSVQVSSYLPRTQVSGDEGRTNVRPEQIQPRRWRAADLPGVYYCRDQTGRANLRRAHESHSRREKPPIAVATAAGGFTES